jgi:hypothetical protein
LIVRAQVHGMRIIGATLTPFEDAFKGMQFEGCYNADNNGFAAGRGLLRRCY